jgi:hypothetical protein
MTWSLGIEEQFYLVLPPLLLLLRRWQVSAIVRVTLIVSALSFLLAVLATPIRPTEAFYLLPTRAWELGIGVALAMAQEAGLGISRGQRWIALGGLAAIIGALTLFDEQVRFPGYAALLPTLGTVALIATPGSTINRRILGSRPFVAIGTISYSWYLWHWPLLALLRVCAAGPVPPWLLAVVGLGSIVPAYCSWRWIEQPFRHPRPALTAHGTLARYGAAVAACLAILVCAAASGGLTARVGKEGARVEAMIDASRGNPCLASYGVDRPNLTPICAPRGDRPLVALLGDSHASALGDALRDAVLSRGYDLLRMTAASCPPLLGASLRLKDHPGASHACAAFNAAAIAKAADDPRVKLVILTGFWESPFSQHALATGDGLTDADPNLHNRASDEELRIALARTLTRLHNAGKRILVLGDAPWIRFDPALHAWAPFLSLRAAIESHVTIGLDAGHGRVPRRYIEPLVDTGGSIVAKGAATVPETRYVALRGLLCDATSCRTGDGATPFFIDQQHLSRAGADYVLSKLAIEL